MASIPGGWAWRCRERPDGVYLIQKVNQFEAVPRFADDLELVRSFEDRLQTLAEQGMIIGQYDPVSIHDWILSLLRGMLMRMRVPFPSSLQI